MSEEQYSSADPRHLLPRRFILRPGVVSPLTCRHPKRVHCSCHGATSNATAPAAAHHQHQPKSSPQDPAIRKLELTYQRHLSQILFALRAFPDAASAVRELLLSSLPPGEGGPPHPSTSPTTPFSC